MKFFLKTQSHASLNDALHGFSHGFRLKRNIVWCSTVLSTDDSSLMFQPKDVEEIEKVLNNDFENICNWFVDNKLSIHFGEDKTKSILFASQRKNKNMKKLNIRYQDIEIKDSQVTYLG